MNSQTLLYFISVLLTFLLTGWVAWYAWRQKPRPGVRAYAMLSVGECLLALVELLSLLSRSQAQAQFWFNLRFLFIGALAVLFLIFTLEYQGYRGWLSRTLLALGFIIPLLTQAFIWVPGLHGLWVKQDVGFYQSGPFWMNYPGARIPAVWFLAQSFYSDGLLLAGMVLILLAAWRMRREQLAQGLLLAAGALVSLAASLISALNLLPQLSFNPFIPGLGLSAGLYALAIFRFQILKRSPAQAERTPLPGLDTRERVSLATLLLIFIVFAGGIAAIGFTSYQRYEEQFRIQVEGQLNAIAALKVNQLESWRTERLGDADILHNNPVFVGLVGSFLENPDDAQAGAQLQAWLAAIQTGYHYDGVFLLDPHGLARISAPANPGPVSPYLQGQAVAALGLGQVTFSDFYRDTPSGPIRLALLAPIYAEGLRSRPLGVVLLRIDPATYLYPYLNQWPTSSSTAETLLVRRDGNTVLFLNNLKFQPTAALNLRFPLADTQVLAVKAALGQTGVVSGVDYRGHAVIGYVGPVPGSPWFLVARMDSAEVYAPLRQRLWEMLLFFGLLILAAGAGLLLLWRQRGLRYYRAQLAAAQALRDSEARYRRLFEAARDGILILDAETGVVVDVNPFLVEMLGFPREGIVGKELWELGFFKDIAANKANFLELQQKEYIRYEDLPLETADGRRFHVEFVSNVYQVDHHTVVQCNIRDITERKQAEEKLVSSQKRLRDLNDLQGLLLHPNPIGQKLNLVTETIVRVLGADFARIWIIKPGDRCENGCMHAQVREGPHACRFRDRCLHLVSSSGRFTHTDGRVHGRVPFGSYKIGRIASGEEAEFLTNAVATDPRVHEQAWAKELGLVAFAGCRLVDQNGAPLGVLATFSQRAILPEEYDLLQGIAHITSQVLLEAQADETLRETNEYLENLFDYANAPIIVWDPTFRITRFNHAFESLTGRSAAQVLGQPLDLLFPPDQVPDSMKLIQKTLTGERWEVVEINIQHVNGSISTVLWNSATLFSEDGKIPLATIAQGQDVTERKQSETMLQARLRLVEFAADHSLDELLQQTLDEVCAITDSPIGFYDFVEPDQKTLSHQTWSTRTLQEYCHAEGSGEHFTIDDAGVWVDCIRQRKALIHNDYAALPNRKGLPEGHAPLVRELVVPIFREDLIVAILGIGNRAQEYTEKDIEVVTFFADVAWEIARRKQAEEALSASEAKWRSLFEILPVGVSIVDSTNQVSDVNPALPQILDLSEEALKKGAYRSRKYLRPDGSLMPPEEFPSLRAEKEHEVIRNVEIGVEKEDGAIIWTSVSAAPLPSLAGSATVTVDITESKQAQKVLRLSEERFRSLFENMLNGFAYCQMLVEAGSPPDFLYLQVNRAFESLTGLKGVVGKKGSEVIPGIQESDPELLERYARVAQTGRPETFENYLEPLKMWFSISVYSPQKGYFVTVFDVITDRKRAEQELQAYSEYLEEMVNERTRALQEAQEKMIRQERLATLGQLAGSVGHELRNPLGVISNAIYFLKMTQPDATTKVLEYLDIIEKETKTSDKIVTDLLDFTRIKSIDREPTRVADLFEQTLQRYSVPPSVDVQLDLPPHLPPVYADPAQVVQVLGNLVTNACQAMASADGLPGVGKLTLSASLQGDMIAIAVQDTGMGIPPENMGKLFEPLFTTKTKGIGLGLAVSQKLIEANGGRIEACSEPGKGSTFTVYLPVVSS